MFSVLIVLIVLSGLIQNNEGQSIAVLLQESPAVADKPARRLRKVCTVYVRAVGW